jgi:hypothetical protein
MSWATKRQFKYLSIVLGVFLLVIFWIIYPMIFKKATCFDGKLNGTEIEIDCGGSCSRFCNSQVSAPIVIWSRAFLVTENVYNLVAYIENQNKNAAVAKANYEFRIYDTSNKLIGRREGSTFIPPNQQFVIFEPRFSSGESEVKSISFEFMPPFIWQKKEPTVNILPVKVDNIVLDNDFNLPSLTARIKNESIYNIPPFDVVAILYDTDNNAINVSKTQKDGLVSNGSLSVSFTWPEALTSVPVKNDILVQINPFSFSF